MELWKDVAGYEGLYQVSNLGHVRSLNYNKTGKEKLLSPCVGRNYLIVHLHKNGVSKFPRIHRLVAEAFIPNPLNLPCVNHRDENKLNNCVENLEWCSFSYNSNYGTAKTRWTNKNTNGKLSKPIIQYALDGSYIDIYPSAAEVERQSLSRFNQHFHRGNISKCARGAIPSAYGYLWKLAV